MTTVDKYKVNIYDAAGSIISTFGGSVTPTNTKPTLANAIANNFDMLAPTDVSNYKAATLQVTGIGSATVQVQASLDATFTVFATLIPYNSPSGSITAVGLYKYDIPTGVYIRVRTTAYTSGTVTALFALSSIAPATPFQPSMDTANVLKVSLYTASTLNPFTQATPIDGLANSSNTLVTISQPEHYNGATWDRQRTPAIFKDLNAVAIGAIATVWTPTASKKFRLMGGVISVSAAASVLFEDNAAAAFVFRSPKLLVDTPFAFTLGGNGFLSAAANNVLKATSSAAANITGTLYGTEE